MGHTRAKLRTRQLIACHTDVGAGYIYTRTELKPSRFAPRMPHGGRAETHWVRCMGWVSWVPTEPVQMNSGSVQMNTMGEGKLRHGTVASSSGERQGGEGDGCSA